MTNKTKELIEIINQYPDVEEMHLRVHRILTVTRKL